MKRTRFVLLAVVAALVLMGAGYAAWTQTFNITSNISTGELFVQVNHDGTTVSVVKWDDASQQYKEVNVNDNYGNHYLDPESIVDVSDGTASSGGVSTLASITYDIGDIYPGTKITSEFSFKNLGTLKVKTTGKYVQDPSSNSNIDLMDYLNVTVNGEVVQGDNAMEKLENLAAQIGEEIGYLDVDDTATADITLVMEFPFDAVTGNQAERVGMNWTIEVIFDQYNVNVNAE